MKCDDFFTEAECFGITFQGQIDYRRKSVYDTSTRQPTDKFNIDNDRFSDSTITRFRLDQIDTINNQVQQQVMADLNTITTGNDYIDDLLKNRGSEFANQISQQEDGMSEDRKKILDIYKGIGIKPVAKANTEVLTAETQESAILSQAAYDVYKRGVNGAKNYLREQGSGWTLREYNHSGAIFTKGGSTRVVYRGTDFKLPNLTDLTVDAAMVGGYEELHPEYKTARDLFRLAENKYGKVDKVVGYSKGGNIALNLGYDFNIPVEVFNPAVSPRLIAKSKGKTNPVEIHATTEDFASVLSPLLNGNVKVNRSLPNNISINPLQAHSLKNYIEIAERKRVINLPIDEQRVFMSRAQGELLLSQNMLDHIADGETLTSFFEKYEPGDFDTATRQIKYDRIYSQDEPRLKIWRELGGKLNSQESAIIDRLPSGRVSHNFATTTQDRLDFLELPRSTQDAHIGKLIESQMSLTQHENIVHKPNMTFMESVSREIHPTTILRAGLTNVSGMAAGTGAVIAVEEINRAFDIKLSQEQEMAEEAGAIGATSALFSGASRIARLSAGVGGAAGFATAALAQAETEELLEQAGVEKGVAEASSVLVGGAVGGLTTGAVEMGITRAAAIAGSEAAIAAIEGASLASAGATLGLSLLGGLVLSGLIYGGTKLVENIIETNNYHEFREKYKDTTLYSNETRLRQIYEKRVTYVSPERQAVYDIINDASTSKNTRQVLLHIVRNEADQITPEQQLEYYREHDPDKYSEIMIEAEQARFVEERQQEMQIQQIIQEAGFLTLEEYNQAYQEYQDYQEEQDRLDKLRIPREEIIEEADAIAEIEPGTQAPPEVVQNIQIMAA